MNKNFLSPVPRTTLAADVCKRLITHLVRGDWDEGDRIPSERELGSRLGVGRTSLREALKALEIMGLIQDAGRGKGRMFVPSRVPFSPAIVGSRQCPDQFTRTGRSSPVFGSGIGRTRGRARHGGELERSPRPLNPDGDLQKTIQPCFWRLTWSSIWPSLRLRTIESSSKPFSS